ncbi:integrase family protein [Methylomicrobium sp. Wu6]|uniref:tyrosine-type recombinase/integrase n=1 Tax=Methylomicrobium sp. Wu6 TaxID=3107928 RepID=UPI002DD6635B|nr:integrase family protein [Methylomicrobium sp. Wu6]MEC4747405.1 integrase family protein [Methylomicrobium sp. Wu6]
MSKIKFTAGRINGFACPENKQQVFLWDSESPGLALRVTPGSKSYVYQGKLNGKAIRITIGDVKTWSIKDAQAEARRLQTLIDAGHDPRQVKAEKIAHAEAAKETAKTDALRNSVTVQTAWDEYIRENRHAWSDHHIKDHAKASSAPGQPKKRGSGVTVQGVLFPLLQMRLSDINADVLLPWLSRESKTRATVTKNGYILFRAFWHWCAEHKTYKNVIDADALTKQVKKSVPKAGTKKTDLLHKGQLKDWFAAVRNLSNPIVSAYLQGLILTGARREELAGLKWDDIDFKLGAMWIKDKVEAEGRMIPLTPYLRSLIVQLPRRNQWVFSSPTAADGKLAEPRKGHIRALAAAGLEHVTVHGLRRTFASLAEWVEMPVGVVAQIMGHRPNATAERHYKSRPLELLAIWHGKYEAWILEQAGVEFAQAEQAHGLRVVK